MSHRLDRANPGEPTFVVPRCPENDSETLYNITRTDITPEHARIINGLWLWRTPLNAQMHWTYFWGDQDAMVGVREGDRLAPYFELAAPHPSRDEMLSTLDWENAREGVNDLRYITTLQNRIKRATDTASGSVKAAEDLISEMRAIDPRVTESAKAISGRQYDRWRARMFELIESIDATVDH